MNFLQGSTVVRKKRFAADYLFPPPEWTPCRIGYLGEAPPKKNFW
jgi:hypothetical protein